MELLADFIINGAIIGGTPVVGSTLNSTIMKSITMENATINNNIMDITTLNSTASNGALVNATTFNSTEVNSTTAFNGTPLNSTHVMNNSTFVGNTFTNTTLNSSSMNDTSFMSGTLKCNSLNSTTKNSTSFIGTLSSATELNRTATSGQHSVVVANGTVFSRMPGELDETVMSPVSYAASELEAVSPFPLGSTTGKRRSEVTRSTPLKPPKKYRGPGEDREIKRCKRSLSFIPAGADTTPVEGSETPEKPTEKTTTRPRASIERRNKRERNRVKQINNTFVTLRNQLPSDGWSAKRNAKKFSKVDTLRMAIEYIRGLRQLITDHDTMFMSAECLALLASPPAEGHEPSSYQHIPGFMINADSGSDRSGAESVGSSTTDPQTGLSSSYPSSSSSTSSSFSASAGITDFFPPLASNLNEDLLDAFLADMYMAS